MLAERREVFSCFRYASPMLRFDENRPSDAPKDAATVLPVRSRQGEIELFCVERHRASGFLGGAVVFPGGKLSAADRAGEWQAHTTGLRARELAVAEDPDTCRAFAVAALRELFEEAGILPVAGAPLDDARVEALRMELTRRSEASGDDARAFFELCRDERLALDTSALTTFARWITPKAESRRYDTRFYLLACPTAQSGRHDEHETTSSFWATPRELLRRWSAEEIFLAPPTLRSIELFAGAHDIESARVLARGQSLTPLCPFFVQHEGASVLALPGDPLYFEAAPAPADPAAPTRFVLEGSRFVPQRVTREG